MGSLVRSPHQPLAHLVDAAAEKWLSAEDGSAADRQRAGDEITTAFHIGDKPELTFHGLRFLLTISRLNDTLTVSVHEIVQE